MQHFYLHDLAGQPGHVQAPSPGAQTSGLLGTALLFFPIIPSAHACGADTHPAPCLEQGAPPAPWFLPAAFPHRCELPVQGKAS